MLRTTYDKLTVTDPDSNATLARIDQNGYSGAINMTTLDIGGVSISNISTDNTMTSPNDSTLSTQKAVKEYVDAVVGVGGADPLLLNQIQLSSGLNAGSQSFIITPRSIASPKSIVDINGKCTLSVDNTTNDLTVTPTGGDVLVAGDLTATSTTSPQLKVAYDGTHSLTTGVSSAGNATLTASGTKIDVATGNQLNVLDTTNSTSTTTGCATFKGGVGITNDLWIGGTFHGTVTPTLADVTISSTNSATLDSFTVTPKESGKSGSIIVYNYDGSQNYTLTQDATDHNLNLQSTGAGVHVKNTTAATTYTDGALIVDGGASIYKDIWCHGSYKGNLGMTVDDTTESSSHLTGSIITAGGVGVLKNIWCNGGYHGRTGDFVDTTDSSSISTGALTVEGGMGLAKKLYVGDVINETGTTEATTTTGSIVTAGGILAQKAIFTNSATESTTTATGSIVTAGGVGIAKKLTVGGVINDTDTTEATTSVGSIVTTGGILAQKAIFTNSATESTTTATGSIVTAGGVGIAKKLTVGGVINDTDTTEATTSVGSIVTTGGILAQKAIFTNSVTDSTTTATGSIVTAGGVGIAKKLNVGGQTSVTTLYSSDTTEATLVTGAVRLVGGLLVNKAIVTASSTASTTSGTGAIICNGGVGVAGNIHAGGIVYADNTTESTTSLTGSIVTAGGVGVSKNICTNGNILFTGASNKPKVNVPGVVVPASGAGYSSFGGFKSIYGGYAFADGAANGLFFNIDMPYGWVVGSDVVVYFRWGKDGGSGNVVWDWVLGAASANNVTDVTAITNTLVTCAVPTNTNGILQTEYTCTMTGFTDKMTTLVCQIQRKGADVADTFANVAYILSFGAICTVDRVGI